MENNRIPSHLIDFASQIQQNKKNVTFQLNCTCGKNQFLAFKRTSEKRISKGFQWPILVKSAEIDPRARQVRITECTFFGIAVRKTYENWNPNQQINHHTIITLKCPNCGKEFVIFDSAMHGYDGVCAEIEGHAFYPLGQEEQLNEEACGFSIKIKHGFSYEEFLAEFNTSANQSRYANAFLSFKIFQTRNTRKNKKTNSKPLYCYNYIPYITTILQ